MYRFLLTPRWWVINVLAVLAIPFCLLMGSWQLGRFESRVDDHRAVDEAQEEGSRSEARPLDELLPVDMKTSGARATAKGRYDRQLLVPGRRLDDREGFYVLTLLRTEDGKALPVVRGWLPGAATDAKAPEPPSGQVSVTGFLQSSENTQTEGVDKRGGLPSGQVGMISAASLVNLVDHDVRDAWITLEKADAGMKAVPAAAPADSGLDLKAFQNLGYTGEWFVFSGFVVFMWFRLFRREAEFARDAELGLLPLPDAPVAVTSPRPAAEAGPPVDGADEDQDREDREVDEDREAQDREAGGRESLRP